MFPILIGLLLGLGIGGLVRRPRWAGTVSACVVLLGLVAFLVRFFMSLQGSDPQLRGNGYMLLVAFAVYGAIGYGLFLSNPVVYSWVRIHARSVRAAKLGALRY